MIVSDNNLILLVSGVEISESFEKIPTVNVVPFLEQWFWNIFVLLVAILKSVGTFSGG